MRAKAQRTAQAVHQVTFDRVVHKHEVGDGDNHVCAIGVERDIIHSRLHPVAFGLHGIGE